MRLFNEVYVYSFVNFFLYECRARYWLIMRDKYEIFTEIHLRYGRYMRDIHAGYTFESTYGCTGGYVGFTTAAAIAAAARCCCCCSLLLLLARCCCCSLVLLTAAAARCCCSLLLLAAAARSCCSLLLFAVVAAARCCCCCSLLLLLLAAARSASLISASMLGLLWCRDERGGELLVWLMP